MELVKELEKVEEKVLRALYEGRDTEAEEALRQLPDENRIKKEIRNK